MVITLICTISSQKSLEVGQQAKVWCWQSGRKLKQIFQRCVDTFSPISLNLEEIIFLFNVNSIQAEYETVWNKSLVCGIFICVPSADNGQTNNKLDEQEQKGENKEPINLYS